MKETLHTNIGNLNANLAHLIDNKVRVVGLPIDIDTIERYRVDEHFPRTTILYNHAPISAKDPMLFINAIAEVMRTRDVDVLFTRKLPLNGQLSQRVQALCAQYPGRLHFGGDLPISEYYRSLWMADIQVSTATHESLGIATLEAMYTCNSCILPRLGSYPELVENDDQVLYDRSIDMLVDRLRLLIDDSSLRCRLGERLRRFSQQYSPAAVTRSINSVIEEILTDC